MDKEPKVDPSTNHLPAEQSPEHPAELRPEIAPNLPAGQGAVQLATLMFAVAPYKPALQLVHTTAPVRE